MLGKLSDAGAGLTSPEGLLSPLGGIPFAQGGNHLPPLNFTMYKRIDFGEQILEQAEKLTLRDLLDSPTAQVWFVSALGNTARFRTLFEGHDTDCDEYIQFLITKLGQQIGHETRSACYQAAGRIIRDEIGRKSA